MSRQIAWNWLLSYGYGIGYFYDGLHYGVIHGELLLSAGLLGLRLQLLELVEICQYFLDPSFCYVISVLNQQACFG